MNATELDLDTCNEADCVRAAQAMAAGVPVCWAHYRIWEREDYPRRIATFEAARREDEARKRQDNIDAIAASPLPVGARVVRKATTRPTGTIERLYLSNHNGKLTAYVRWDSTLGGGSRIGGGMAKYGAIAVASLRAA